MSTVVTKSRTELGAHPTENGIRFCVWAPHAKAVYVAGTFNDFAEDEFEMEREDDGYWSLQIEKAKVGDRYQYIIETPDGQKLWRNDPYARQLTNSDGDTIITEENFDWEGDDFQMPNWNELVIYELHIGSYNVKEEGSPGTFESAIEKLPYLKDLGINAIELMPINEFAGDYSWGYNPAYPYAVEEAYGGPSGLKAFVKAAHQHGIAVILDVVYNHFGPSDLGLWQFDGWKENGKGGIYFYNDWRSDTPWGDTRPDYGREEVRQYIFDNAMMWLEDFRLDGLRMDMVPYMRNVGGDEHEGSRIDEGFTLIQWINHTVREKYPQKIMIAEDLHGNHFITDSTAHFGCGFGSQWDGDFVHPVRKTLIAPEDHHRDLFQIELALQRSYSGDTFRRIVYTESHDEVANGQARLPEEISPENVNNYYSQKKSALGAALVMTAAGIPMLFQGQELLEDKWFSDQDPIDWSRLDKFNGIHKLFQDLIRLRRNQDGVSQGLTGTHTEILHLNNSDKVLAYLRWFGNREQDSVMIILNFSNRHFEDYNIGMPISTKWNLRFNSDWKGYSEKFDNVPTEIFKSFEEAYDDQPYRASFPLAPYTAYILTIQ